MKTNIVIDMSPSISYVANFLVPELSAKMVLANQIAEFLKM